MAASAVFTYTGGASNAVPGDSLGGTGSTIPLADYRHNLFGPTNPNDVNAGDHVTYRAIDIYNNGTTLLEYVELFVTDTANAESALHFWYETSPGQQIADESTAPTGATWSQPTSPLGLRMQIADLAVGARARIWIRKTVDQGASELNNDLATLSLWYI